MYGWGMGDLAAQQQTIALGTDASSPTCVSWYSPLDPFCWGFWATQKATAGGPLSTSDLSYYGTYPQPPAPLGPPAPVPTADNPDPLTMPPTGGPGAQGTVDATIAAGAAANQQRNLKFFASVSDANPVCNSTILPALGICDSTLYWTAGITAAVLCLMFLGGRR